MGDPASAQTHLRNVSHALLNTLRSLDVGIEGVVLERSVPDSRSIGARFRAGGVIVDVALHDDGRRRLELEASGRAWAAQGGVLVPEVLAAAPDYSWIISRLVECRERRGATFVHAGLAAAHAISTLAPDKPPISRTSWRAPRRSLPVRVGRMFRWGVSPRAFLSARRAVAALPEEVSVHGDLNVGNVLLDARTGRASVVDWEFRGRGPRHSDALRFIATLEDSDDVAFGLDSLLGVVPTRAFPAVAAQLRWQALRAFVDETIVPAHRRNAARRQALRSRCRWAWDRADLLESAEL